MALNMETGKLADVASLDHVNILTNDVEACRQFYIDVLGFEEGFRPDFGFPGLWIYLGGAPVVHFIQTKKKQPLIKDADYVKFNKIVTAAFNQRRKMLRNSMKSWDFSKLVKEKIDFSRRPESLSVEEFALLVK